MNKIIAQPRDLASASGSDLASFRPRLRVLDTKTDRLGTIKPRQPGFDYMGFWPIAFDDGGGLCVHESHLRAVA